MTDELRRRFFAQVPHREVKLENPVTFVVTLYRRFEVDSAIVKRPYRCRITDVNGTPYKVIGDDGDSVTCRECTVQELADLMERYGRGAHG